MQRQTGKNFNDALAGGNSIINSYFRGKWDHEWTDRIATNVMLDRARGEARAGARDARNLFAFSILYLSLLFATLLAEHAIAAFGGR